MDFLNTRVRTSQQTFPHSRRHPQRELITNLMEHTKPQKHTDHTLSQSIGNKCPTEALLLVLVTGLDLTCVCRSHQPASPRNGKKYFLGERNVENLSETALAATHSTHLFTSRTTVVILHLLQVVLVLLVLQVLQVFHFLHDNVFHLARAATDDTVESAGSAGSATQLATSTRMSTRVCPRVSSSCAHDLTNQQFGNFGSAFEWRVVDVRNHCSRSRSRSPP